MKSPRCANSPISPLDAKNACSILSPTRTSPLNAHAARARAEAVTACTATGRGRLARIWFCRPSGGGNLWSEMTILAPFSHAGALLRQPSGSGEPNNCKLRTSCAAHRRASAASEPVVAVMSVAPTHPCWTKCRTSAFNSAAEGRDPANRCSNVSSSHKTPSAGTSRPAASASTLAPAGLSTHWWPPRCWTRIGISVGTSSWRRRDSSSPNFPSL